VPDPNEPEGDDFFSEFLDDYFAECEEHLAALRRGLLTLEQFIDQPRVDDSLLDELFRTFHTLKGISGMVGLSAAEALAHEMEGYLRLLRRGERQLSQDGFDALLAGTKLLEQVIEAHRTQSPLPEIHAAVAALTQVTNTSIVEIETGPTESATTPGNLGKPEWRFLFVPSAARAEAGLNVNHIRSRLQEIGEIIRATPLIEEGEVTFEFIVLANPTESVLEDLRSIGLTFAPITSEREIETTPTTPFQPDRSAPASPTISVRVDLARLDQLMLLVGDLVVSRARLERNLSTIRNFIPSHNWRQLQEVNATLGKQLKDLRNDVMRVRMVPIAEVFERMRFVVRDIARETNKSVTVDLTGQETEIDKFLVERLMDPLLHLVRNSVSHGIESEAERIRVGKSSQGHIFLRAETAGELVVLEIGDDGRGIDLDRVAAQAPGIELKNREEEIDAAQLLETISVPGFSTTRDANRASGRGVGMDVVRRSIRDLDGSLSLETNPGKGTKFRIELPLTLAITDALIATVDGQTFAINRSSVQEVMEVEPQKVKVLENNEIIVHRDQVLPLVRLSRVFNLQDKKEGLLHAFVVGTGRRATGLVVDKILGLREVVVRSLNDPLTEVCGVAGATELGDGRPILILDARELLNGPQASVSSRTT